ncbi:hypothetical protein Curi_c14630 [Gottschalkia acidurici 9a]|uniref:Uncharacterized protein n=1 Tax=Gottschalkia acidurici (strain ATCC 7906 / DSM 604 / BCRC 14475 / CIP 104303 / KCTC 5404 / NCIMB 10678 / 9a) TaxID=1128398 RepID=K0AXD5_GOTA9|nr:hypothetical protein [Gottschalkia acidurici]AFS78473.1 hypothetical protein Curi_c14630 [Gottschalkia acidurici 9a]
MIITAIDYVIEEGVLLAELGSLRTDDIERFLYKCLITRTCCIKGRKGAEVHHVDKVRKE